MNYGRQILLGNPAERARFTGGLATPDVDQRGGIFGPQGYGGGIFDGSNALGQVEWKQADERGDVTAVQLAANDVLSRLGYTTIGADGAVGPRTCGAISLVAEKGTQADFSSLARVPTMGDILAVCDAHGGEWIRPAKAGGGVAPPAAKEEPAAPRARAGMGVNMTTVGLLVLFAGGAAFLWSRRRKR